MGNAEGVEQGHFGLHGMRERAERLGGTLAVESTPGSGTTVRATVIRRDYDGEIVGPAEAESAPATTGPRPFAARSAPQRKPWLLEGESSSS